jgi:hypothetical protein
MASKLLCCLDADQGAREQGKADRKLKWARYFNFGSVANKNREVSFQPCYSIYIGLNSILAIKLESTVGSGGQILQCHCREDALMCVVVEGHRGRRERRDEGDQKSVQTLVKLGSRG